MTTTTAPNAQAWLAKEATSLGPFVVRLDGDRVGFGALAPGHWVVVVDAAGALKRVGRILRIRADLESTTLYFDKLHTVQNGGLARRHRADAAHRARHAPAPRRPVRACSRATASRRRTTFRSSRTSPTCAICSSWRRATTCSARPTGPRSSSST